MFGWERKEIGRCDGVVVLLVLCGVSESGFGDEMLGLSIRRMIVAARVGL